MSQRLKNIYTHLVQNRKHQLIGWHNEYKRIVSDIHKIKANLDSGKTLREIATYEGTSFADFDSFIKVLLYDVSNGVSSRGQSVLSWDNLNKFKIATNFDMVISNIIQNPSLQSYEELQNFWREQDSNFNPVLINRAIASCSIELTSTVDEGKFNVLFYWLQNEKIISPYTNSNLDWFNKNIFVMEQFKSLLKDVPDIDDYWISLFYWELFVNIANPFSLKKQIVKYGAPGTGKTFTAKQNTKLLFEVWKDEFANSTAFDFNNHIETVQFHPSYTYEDFLEGLRPKLDNNNQAQLILQNGIFKDFCKKAGKWEHDVAKLSVSKPMLENWKELTINDIEIFKNDLKEDHWKYIYAISDKEKKIADAVPPYFFIIDEINRAELSRVFGELMYCLEYRGIEGAIKTQYAHLNNSDTGMIKIGDDFQFFIPHNIYLIGTMNTIDRSVESFDFALRRRFRWEEVMPDTSMLHYHLLKHNSKWVSLAENLENLNSEIEKEPLLGRDFQIGHAYLWDLNYSKELTMTQVKNAIWQDSIAPLLQEYLRGTGREDLLKKFANKFGIN